MSDILIGHCMAVLRTLPAESVQCCVTSPPYWGLRAYGTEPQVWGGQDGCEHEWGMEKMVATGNAPSNKSTLTTNGGNGPLPGDKYQADQAAIASQGAFCHLCGAWRGELGLEPTPDLYVEHLVAVMREVRRVLRKDGVAFVNLGDSYAGANWRGGGVNTASAKQLSNHGTTPMMGHSMPTVPDGLKPKDLVGIPWRVAFALQADGWWLRSDIIWHKPNPMPESVTDRPTKSHEYVFLLSKSARYYYDAEAIKEACSPDMERRAAAGHTRGRGTKLDDSRNDLDTLRSEAMKVIDASTGRNARSVWSITTRPFSGAKLLADYVGKDGKPYRASPDCPIHGHLAQTQKKHTAGCGEQPGRFVTGNLGNENHHAQSPANADDAMTCHSSQDGPSDNALPQTPQSTGGHRTASDHHECMWDAQSSDHTSHTSESHENQDDSWGFDPLVCSEPAMRHNTQTSKTDRAHQIVQRGSVCEGTPCRTQSTLLFDAQTDLAEHNAENKNEGDCAAHGQGTDSAQTVGRNARKRRSLHTSDKHYTCTCEIVQIDHFATMPVKLAERCVLAGSKAGDTVLDPFGGAGTTALAAAQNGREYVIIELNEGYAQLARERLQGVNVKMLGVIG